MTIHQLLKNYWGYDQFRPLQEEIIQSVIDGKNTLAILPTGGGKSICYQIPGLYKPGICLVVSPLIALMKDQVFQLRKRGITAFAIYAGMTRKEVIQTLETAAHSNCKFLYVSPERLSSSNFIQYIQQLPIDLIAVDEAHCISQWGYDFRPAYLKIAGIKELFPEAAMIALTASATPNVQQDICAQLGFEDTRVFKKGFFRPNLIYRVKESNDKINHLIQLINHVNGSCIIYCRNRRKTKFIADILLQNNISAHFYHAGLAQEVRDQRQEDWIKDKVPVMVCTNAFGMGIDKPNVRLVIHIDLPECIENYYQEAGRAGRDEQPAWAVLLYDQQDLSDLKEQVEKRFPPLEEVRTMYKSLMNHLQIPINYGKGHYYKIDLTTFVKNFNLDAFKITHGLKLLEQEGYLSFNEQVFTPSKVIFVADREWLREFQEKDEVLSKLIGNLLRHYEGIYDVETAIHEKTIAYWLKTDEVTIRQQLKQLAFYGIIEYHPVENTPQVYLLEDRVALEAVTIQQELFDFRKEQFAQRTSAMTEYATQQKHCRSKFISNYFGEKLTQDCDVCDVCKQKIKNRQLQD
jgi:ATP-dependent DNA helicase RecQ